MAGAGGPLEDGGESMDAMSSILLLVERGDQAHRALNKALLLARHMHAKLELFLCESERDLPAPSGGGAQALERARANQMAEAREYLLALRKSMLVPEVEVSSDAVCHVSVREALADKLKRSRPDLVVKAANAGQPDPDELGGSAWLLIASCAVPLLLARDRAWHPVPRFAAALDCEDRRQETLGRRMMAIGEMLSRECSAELDILCARPPSDGHAPIDARRREWTPGPTPSSACRLQHLRGTPSEVLPRFVMQRDYDMIIMGKPRHSDRSLLSASVARRVLKASTGDVLFVHASGGAAG